MDKTLFSVVAQSGNIIVGIWVLNNKNKLLVKRVEKAINQ